MTNTSADLTAETSRSNARVFISYSRKDMNFADRLEAMLKTRGIECLIDRSDIYAFEEWWKRVEALISRADTIVFVISLDAVSSEVCRREVAFAALLNKRFAPVVYRQVDQKAVPETLARLNFIFFDDETQFEQSADRLAEALQTDIAWIRRHTEFGEQARRWASAKKPSGLLPAYKVTLSFTDATATPLLTG
jgi:TIR domain